MKKYGLLAIMLISGNFISAGGGRIFGTTAAGGLIGGLAGGPRGAGIGAAAGFGVGLLSEAAERRRDYYEPEVVYVTQPAAAPYYSTASGEYLSTAPAYASTGYAATSTGDIEQEEAEEEAY